MMSEAGTPFESGGTLPVPRAQQRPGHAPYREPEERLDRLHSYFLEGCADEIRPVLEAVLDGGGAVAEALRTANAARARRPEVPIVIAADTGGKSPGGVRVFDRWNETEELLLDVERLLAERVADAGPIARG